METTFNVESTRLPKLGQLFSFVSTSPRNSERLSGSATAVVDNVSTFLNDLLEGAVACKTKADFVAYRRQAFSGYMGVLSAVSDLLQAMVGSKSTLDRLVYDSLSEMEGEFKEFGASRFGDAVADQALFTIWTFRKIKESLTRVIDPCTETNTEADRSFAA